MKRSLASHRRLLWALVKRELRSRYAGSLMGVFWSFFNPALSIIVIVMVFSGLMRANVEWMGQGHGYAIYLCTGILPWSSLQEALQRSCTVFIENQNFLKRDLFPKELLVAQIVFTSTIHLLLGFAFFIPIAIVLGVKPSPVLFTVLPCLIMLQAVFSLGLALLVSTATVFLRDLSHLVGSLFTILFWMTPIVYPLSIIPKKFQVLVRLNPFTHIIDAYRKPFLHPEAEPWSYALPAVLALAAMCAGSLFFRKFSDDIVDEV